MSERCIVRVKFTPAGGASEVRRAVGGFLRYVQHRDMHADTAQVPARPKVSGLLKYVAYREKATSRAELFGPDGAIGTAARKEFATFVASSLERSQPHFLRGRDGRLMDRRRAVSRFVISPEHAQGLDLERLTRAAVTGLESEMGAVGVRWIAAVHRNTRHNHVHLVLAGMHEESPGLYRRVDVTKPRLAAMKEAVAQEIERQRHERGHSEEIGRGTSSAVIGGNTSTQPALQPPVFAPGLIRTPPITAAVPVAESGLDERGLHAEGALSILRLRAVARHYQRQMQRDAEFEARRSGWERAA
jgi:hypothetical protein